MRHDAHFLSRIRRLDREHAEIALGLYYDSKLVRFILEDSKIPERAERVAICLGPRDRGPFIIVARDGHFVTALGEGMVIQDDLPLVSRHRLDSLSETVSSLRELVAEANGGGEKRLSRLLSGVYRSGPGLSREEFDELARWLPLLQVKFTLTYFGLMQRVNESFDQLTRVKKLKPRHDALLHEFWRDNWAMAHLTLLLASDGGAVARELFSGFESDNFGCTLQLSLNLVRTGLLSLGLRGVWIASKLPGLTVPAAKRRYLGAKGPLMSVLSDGASLAAIGLRHRRYRSEVTKVLERAKCSNQVGATKQEVFCHMAREYNRRYPEMSDALRQHTVEQAQRVMMEVFEEVMGPGLPPVEELHESIPVSMFLIKPMNVRSSIRGVRMFLEHVPWAVGAQARDFYPPQPFARFVRGPWAREDGLELLEGCVGEAMAPRQEPVVKGPKVGRNMPCPCGSGRKYKRCCLK